MTTASKIRADNRGSAVAVAVCEVAQSGAFRKALSAIAGYRADHSGEIRCEP